MSRRDNPAAQNTNFCPLVYTFDIEVNSLDFNPKYPPQNPQTLGEKIRKTRMDKGMTQKEAAALFGVTDTTVINWEIRGKVPQVDRMQKVTEFLSGRDLY